MTAALSGTSSERNTIVRSRKLSPMTTPMNHGRRVAMRSEMSMNAAVEPPTYTCTSDRRTAAGITSLAQPTDEVARRGRLRRRLREHADHRGVAGRVQARLAHGLHVRVLSHRVDDAGERGRPLPAGTSATSSNGPLKPLPKPVPSRS